MMKDERRLPTHEHDPAVHTASWQTTNTGLNLVNMQLRNLAATAFHVRPDEVSGGPDWIASKGFDLSAKVTPDDPKFQLSDLTEDQRLSMLRNLLETRFRLKAHIETTIKPVYELVVAKSGSRLVALPPDSAPHATSGSPSVPPSHPRYGSRFAPGRLEAWGYNLDSLTRQLDSFTGRTVVDKTGLTGEYDFTLEFTPDAQRANPNPDSAADLKPDLFAALQQQLGLRLIPARDPIRTLVIDHAELPTPN